MVMINSLYGTDRTIRFFLHSVHLISPKSSGRLDVTLRFTGSTRVESSRLEVTRVIGHSYE